MAPQAIRGSAQEGAGGSHEDIACLLWEDSARHHQEGEVRHAYAHAADHIYCYCIYIWYNFTSIVSYSNDSIIQFVDALCSRFEESQKLTRELLIDMSMRLGDNKGKNLAHE